MDADWMLIALGAVVFVLLVRSRARREVGSPLGSAKPNTRPEGALASFGDEMAMDLIKDANGRSTSFSPSGTSANPLEARYACWVLESAIYVFAANNRPASSSQLDGFFSSFWPTVRKNVQLEFGSSPELVAAFDRDVEELAAMLSDAAALQHPSRIGIEWGRLIGQWFDQFSVDVSGSERLLLGAEYMQRAIATSNMLNRIPSIGR